MVDRVDEGVATGTQAQTRIREDARVREDARIREDTRIHEDEMAEKKAVMVTIILPTSVYRKLAEDHSKYQSDTEVVSPGTPIEVEQSEAHYLLRRIPGARLYTDEKKAEDKKAAEEAKKVDEAKKKMADDEMKGLAAAKKANK